MTTRRGYARRALFLAGAAMLGLAGCLPIPYTVTLSPEIEGLYLRQDGAPVAGARVAVSIASGDSTCAKPRVSATTDASGRFTLPATRRHKAFVWLIPFEEMICYQLCAGKGETFSGVAYDYCRLNGVPESESLLCIESPAPAGREGTEVACESRRRA
jgi:hypothetical protein